MQKSPFRRLISFESLSQYVSDTLSENASSSVSPLISRTMAVETLESRVLLSASPTLITDPIALMADSSTSITDFERVYHPTGSAAILYPENQTSTAFIFPAGKSVQSYTLTLGTGVSTTSYSMNISVVLGKDNLSSGNFTAKLYDSSKVLVSDGLINSTDGTISFSGITNTGGTSYTLQISRTENTAEQISYGIKAYQSVLGTVADVAVQSGTFAQSTGQTTNSYTFSLAKNTAGSVCVYAPESQNVTVVLYQGSTKIAQAVNSSDGYYTIPAFYNSNTSSGTTEYTVKVTGGSNLQTEAYTLTVSKNGVYNAQSDNSTETATDLGKVGSVIAGSVSGTSQTLERTAIDAGLSYSTGFGSVIAYDSNRLYVSTPKQTTNSSILFYSPDLNSDSWTQTQSWSKPSECASDGLFGCSLSASDNWLAAGASYDTVNGVKTGSVYLYNQTTKNVQRITPADGKAGDCFGASVVVKGEWLFVGSTSAEGGQTNSGAVYVYHLNSQTGVWDYSQKIVSETNVSIAKFGFALDCDGTTLAVSAPFDSTDGILDADGAVYTYQLRGSQWTLTQTISLASLTSVPGGFVLNLNDMQFGYSLKLNNGKLVIGCPGFKNGNVKGIAGVFEQNDTGDWINTSTLYQSSQFVSEFGTSVDISGNKIIVSAAGQSCSVYVFQTSSASNQSWELASTISSTGVDNFGQSVLIAGDKVIVSSPSSESGVTSSQLLQSYSSLGTANYYLLNITSRTGADATFRFAPTNGLTLNDVDVFLTDAQGNRLDSLLTLTNSYGGIYTTGSIELGTNASGTYYLCVQPHSGCSGDYSVSVSYAAKGEFNADLQNPQESARITQMPSKLIFKFSDVFNCSSLTTATLVVNTGVKSVTLNSSNCTIIDGKTISVSTSAFSSLTGQISFSFTGITDLWGNTISSDSSTLYVDTTAPGLTGSSYIDYDGTKVYYSGSSASIKQSSSTVISLTFDDDINLPESAAAIKRWISITGSNGNSIDFDTAVNTSTHTVVLTISTTLSDDAYTIELSDNFVDMAGNKLNSASSSWTFFVNSTESISMPNVTSGMTDGSLLYTSSISGNISQSGETDKFTIRIDADNMYSVYVVPNSSSALKPTVTVVSGSSTIGTATATSTGTTAALEGKLVSGDTYKEYTIQVTGASNSTGGYTVYVVLNGVLNTPTSSSTVKALYTGTSSWFSPAFANTNTTKSRSFT